MKIRQALERVRQSLRVQPVRRPRKARRQLELEGLEERKVPTVIYNPVFGPEPLNDDDGDRVNNPPVYLVLWGSYWNGTSSPQSQIIEQAAADVMASPYLSGIQSYG